MRVARVRETCPEEVPLQEHIHTGFLAFMFAGLSAIAMIQLVRLGSAELVKRQALEPAGKVLGSLVHFG